MSLTTSIRFFLATVLISFSTSSISADTILQDWQFGDPNGTALNSVANTGSIGTPWNFGGPQVQNGNLNIGDTEFFKWDLANGQVFRTVDFPAISTGIHVFEFQVAEWNLGGTDGVGDANNGIRFNFGSSSSKAQLELEVAGSGTDIRVRSQNSTNGSLTGSNAQSNLGALDLTNSAPVTVQLEVDLDSGLWETRVDFGTGFVDLVTDGGGMNSIDQIQLIMDARGGSGWEHGGVGGTATEFVKIDSITLTQIMAVPEPASLVLLGLAGIGFVVQRRRI